jgi:hypothetical protein
MILRGDLKGFTPFHSYLLYGDLQAPPAAVFAGSACLLFAAKAAGIICRLCLLTYLQLALQGHHHPQPLLVP